MNYRPEGEKAAIIEISDDGKTSYVRSGNSGFIDFPGGAKKFTIRLDPRPRKCTGRSRILFCRDMQPPNPGSVRNVLALIPSPELRPWAVRCSRALSSRPLSKHGFQYVEWLFEDRDMIAVSRTAYGEGENAAHRQHDANYLTFRRFANFRELSMDGSV